MKIETEIVEIRCNGKVLTTIRLNRESPGTAIYFENGDITKMLGEGKPKKQAKIEYRRRAATALFNSMVGVIDEIYEIDPGAAAKIFEEMNKAHKAVFEGMGV